MGDREDHFTVFVRLPFARGDFIDPPPVAWSAAKERDLWEVLSKSSKGHEIDWRGLAERFEVTQAFLLQQAAWLYERQLSQVRAQMRRMGSRSSNTASPLPSSNTASVVSTQPLRRTGSGVGFKVLSRPATQPAAAESSTPGTPNRSKSSFAARTVAQGGPIHPKAESTASRSLSRRTSKENEIGSRTHSRRGSIQQPNTKSPRQEVVHEVDSSSDENMTQSRMLHRRPNPAASRRTAPGRKPQHMRRPSAPQLDEEDEDDTPAFLPFSTTSGDTTKADSSTSRDPAATLRGGMAQTARPSIHRRSTSERILPQQSTSNDQLTSSTSSTSENQANPRPRSAEHRQQGRENLPNPLSPRQQAALAAAAGLSPRLRRAGNHGGHGSESSPSMGSSFSDLDDASVTQSALEEALLSGMGNTTMTMGGPSGAVGNVANRVSGISQALRSRYFDARGGESQR
ncbi:hypothetical protein LTR05_003236 [Lithohypha guttulata]|uniref:Autophagy-related protein 29 n=1 Tax=Lithohypha guttulata TaxID=1690604 RepID=A0AAN7T5A9_9EURO|nr:hypothetical protein LTR05_003236 [Lithohypha guttulata]